MTTSRPLKLGLLIPTRGILLKGQPVLDPSLLFSMAQRAEEAGLDSIWVGDSLLAKPRLEPLSTLAALAMHTKRVKLGTAVLLAPLRQPVQLAQMAATIDVLSGGRLVLGVGVGGVFTEAQKQEWLAVGVSPLERGARMTELMQVCRLLWKEERVNFKGRFYTVEDVALGLKPIQADGIPMILACHYSTGAEAQYQRAAQYADGVMGISDTPQQFSEVLKRVRALSAEAGREPGALRSAFYMSVNIDNDAGAATEDADAFIRSYYGQNFWPDKWGPFGPAQAVAERILEYARAGAEEIIVRFASIGGQESQLDAFIEEVLPEVQETLKVVRE